MKILNTLILFLFSVLAIGQPSDALTAAQIVDSSLSFCGGEKQIAQIHSSTITYLLIQPDKSTAIITEKRKTGNKYVQSILSMTHVPQTTYFDSKKLTSVNGSSLIQVDDLQMMEEIKLKTYAQIQFGYKMLGYQLSRLADKKFQNFDCYVITAKSSTGYTTMNFFDKTNFRLLMVAYPNGNKSLMIDYTIKDSVLFNSYIINTFANSDNQQALQLQQIELNANISDLWFTCPYTDQVYTPVHIKTGAFESTNGDKVVFTRTEQSQDYYNEQGKVILRRFLKWTTHDTYGLVDEKAIRDTNTSAESEILVRIISWDDNEYVCHWIAGEYTDTQDYKVRK
ncbi:hypothetical protein Q0590_25515 [Rhodocytophaga aerolata]|uniref:Uncharacterized protein n=1 Tax=Rhodocytophaga aerolata TaxID=455078 RepID=A0ABT8RC36_9BACT|nr:hypothetical protein [Rhodocytophaga aerolata]MDO1449661.1 hypothetical protein [Rhodocytophaga aerolata]